MVSVAQIKKGAEIFCVKEIERQLPLSKAFMFGTMAGIVFSKLDIIAERAKDAPMSKQLGIINEDGEIDDETLFDSIRKQAEKGNAQFDLPIVGNLSFSPEDIDKLHQYIIAAK